MALTIGDALLKLGVDTSNLTKGMENAVRGFKSSLAKIGAEVKDTARVNEEYTRNIEAGWKKIMEPVKAVGVAFTAIGAAGLKFSADARILNSVLAQTAITLGTTTGDMRQLALSITNVSTPLEEVVATFEILARAGMRNTEEIKKTANAFDGLADATGGTADGVAAQLIPAFKALGIQMPQNTEDLDKFTWLAKNTTVDLSDFATVVQRLAPEMSAAGISMDDVIIALATLESRGISGRKATQQLGEAITKASETGISLSTALGLTSTEVDTYKTKLDGAVGITDKYADAANTQFGIMDKLKQAWSELTFRFGSLLTPLEPVMAAMTALGPMMIFLSSSLGLAAIKTIAHTASIIANTIALIANKIAMLGLLGPLGLVIAATGGLIYGLTKLYSWLDNLAGGADKVSERLGVTADKIEDVVIAEKDLAEATGGATEYIEPFILSLGHENLTLETATDTTNDAADAMITLANGTKLSIAAYDKLVDTLTKFNTEAKRRAEEAAKAEIDAIEERIKAENEALDTLLDNLEEYYKAEKDAAKKVADDAINAIDDRMEAERDAHDKRMSNLEVEYRAIRDNLDAQLDIALGAYQDQIDLINDQLDAEEKALQDSLNAEKIAGFESGILNATTAEEKKRIQDELNAFLAELARVKHRQELEDQIAAIRDQMDLARQQSKDAQDLATSAYEAKKLLEEQALTGTIDNLNAEKEALQDALQVKLDGYDTDYNKAVAIEQAKHDNLIAGLEAEKVLREAALTAQLHQYDLDIAAFDENIRLKLLSTAEFVRQYNALIAQMGQMPAPIVPGGPPVYVPGEGGGIIWTPPPVDYVPPGYEPPTQYATGGLIPEPTLLYGLKSQKAYAIAGEAGPERVSPMGAGGASNITNTNNFNIASLVVREQADVERIAQELYRLERLRGFAYGRS